jgi:hypothetical protein
MNTSEKKKTRFVKITEKIDAIKKFISHIKKPAKAEKKIHWTIRWIIGVLLGFYFCFTMLVVPVLFQVGGLLIVLNFYFFLNC